jgi:hypothetical protein
LVGTGLLAVNGHNGRIAMADPAAGVSAQACGSEFAILPTTSDCDDMRALKDPQFPLRVPLRKIQSSGIAALTHISEAMM